MMIESISTVIALVSVIVAGFSALSSWKSADAARRQLELVQRKIGMVTDPEKMTEVLPVWYIDRMSTDEWGFGLLLASGDILAIGRINGVSDDHQWMEVSLLEKNGGPADIDGQPVLYAGLPKRNRASVRVDQVQAAFELWTS